MAKVSQSTWTAYKEFRKTLLKQDYEYRKEHGICTHSFCNRAATNGHIRCDEHHTVMTNAAKVWQSKNPKKHERKTDRLCRKCNRRKALTEFDGLRTTCHACVKTYPLPSS